MSRVWELVSSVAHRVHYRSITQRWRVRLALGRPEVWLWGALFFLALALRLWWLDARPPHHDEAVHGHFARELLHRHSYRYDPTYHGPLQYFVLAGLFALLGETDLVLRLYSALSGAALTLVPALVRHRVGVRSALAMGLLFAVSPSFLYFSRFARNDVPVVLFTALALAFLWRRARASGSTVWACGLFLGLHAASKETIYVYGVLWVGAGMATALWWGWGKFVAWFQEVWPKERRALLRAMGLFTGVCVVFYTAFFSWPGDVWFFSKAIAYWYGQHVAQRVAGPWYYYLPRLALYEFLIFGLAVAGVWRRRRRLTPGERFFLLWGLGSLGAYAYLGEKVPWLSVHQLIPWVPLAGVELGYRMSVSRRFFARGVIILALAATAWSAVASSFLYPTIEVNKPQAELMVFVQTTRQEQQLAFEGFRATPRVPDGIVAAVQGEGAWPLSWQWRDLRVQWGLPQPGQRPPLVVTDPGVWTPEGPTFGNYRCEVIPLRAWWVEDWSVVEPEDILVWFFRRRSWSPRGSTDVQVCRAPPTPGE